MIGTRIEKTIINNEDGSQSISYDTEQYRTVAEWCYTNNATIVERDTYFEVVAIEEEILTEEEKNKTAAAVKKTELQNEASMMMLSVLAGGSLTEAQTAYAAKINEIPNNVAVYIPEVFPIWSGAGVKYEEGKRVQYNGVLYEVVKEHVSQENWKPDVTPSEYTKVISSISGEIPEWEQPLPTNAYKLGDRVKHNGRYYESTYDGANVWEPGVVGEEFWKDITDEIGEAS